MAQVTPISRHLQLQFQVGTTTSGAPKLKSQNYPHVSPIALDDDILAVGQAIAGLFNETLYEVARVDQSGLTATPTTTGSTGTTSGSSGSGTTTTSTGTTQNPA